jgi:CspA family cold shock protein
MTGTIKKLVSDKGFGFITAEGLAKDLFFHSNSLNGVAFAELREGDAVSFDTEETPKGPAAVNVARA